MTSKASLGLAAFLFGLLAGPAIWAQSPEPSLGDVARHKPSIKAKRVVTNDEIPPSPDANKAPSPTPSTSKAEDAPVKDANQPAPEEPKSPERQAKLQQLTIEHERLLKVVKEFEDKIAETSDQQRKDTLTGVLQHVRQSLADNEKEMERWRAPAPAAANPAKPSEEPPVPEPPQ